VFNGRGAEFVGVLEGDDPAGALVRLTERLPHSGGEARIVLGFAPPPGQRVDLLIEKAVELGAAVLQPVLCERVQGYQAEAAARRSERWQRKAREAARQSQRADVPEMRPPIALAEFLASERAPLGLVALIEGAEPLWSVLAGMAHAPTDVALLVGPAGGLTKGEADAAARAGFRAVSLGPHVLRTETAGLVLLAGVQFWLHRCAPRN
jgi:16S rRNA (uracil1498-N3)-methyltransferase